MPSTKKQTQDYINLTEKPINKNKKYKRGLSKKLRQKLKVEE